MNANNQMIFRDNTQKMVWGKSILLLMSSVSTGKTINRSIDCLRYYNGRLAGISALFSAIRESNGLTVNTIFTKATYRVTNQCCPLTARCAKTSRKSTQS